MRGNQQYPDTQRHDMRGNRQYQDPSNSQRNDTRVNQQYPDTANSPRMGMGTYQQENAAGGNASSQNFSRPRGTVEGMKAVVHGIHVRSSLLSPSDETISALTLFCTS